MELLLIIFLLIILIVIYIWSFILKRKIKDINTDIEEVSEPISNTTETLDNIAETRIEKSKEYFKRVLSSMHNVSITIKKDTNYTKKLIRDMPIYNFSSITKSSSKNLFKDFISIDVETTGLSPRNDDIVEISAIRFKNYTPTEYMSTLVKPKKEISEEVSMINNITNDMLTDAPLISEVIDSFSEFISGYNIVGYNLEFDLKFLYVNNLDVFSEKRRFFDAYELAKKVIDSDYIYDYKLSTVCKHEGIYRDTEHRGLSDALATGMLYRDLSIEKTESTELLETNTFINEDI